MGFRGELIKRTEVEVRVEKLMNGKAAGRDEVTGDIKKKGGGGVKSVVLDLEAVECGL